MTTLQDVARLAGVSMSTASYALTGTRAVTEKTRKKVQDAMAELGYVPNESARNLATKRTRNIALIMPSGFNALDGTLAAILDSAAKAAIARNYRLSLWPAVGSSEQPMDPPHSIATGISGSADGVILMEVLLDDPRIPWLNSARIPTVLIGRSNIEHSFDSVDIDFEGAIVDAIEQLRSLGHTDIGFINHSRMSYEVGYGPTRRSHDAYLSTLADPSLDAYEFCGESVAEGEQAAENLLRRHPEITAVLVMNERASFGVQRFINANEPVSGKIRSIVTVASSPGVSELANPSFASFDVPAQALGALAVDRLIRQLETAAEHESGGTTLVECAFVPGDSLSEFS